ncbi:4763_t:CDS:2 [Funneliformis caledonium]|uniref:4763_t:CDS:1 n=1 Tax=Funneliformis caledonium TaxID=1117310 RepID=A0A9N8VIJ8_9GLOM|nr:4763_t:CDS:2 [Funneliformis caledonium]
MSFHATFKLGMLNSKTLQCTFTFIVTVKYNYLKGRITNLNGLSEPSLSNKIYLLDTKFPNNYIWVDKLEPKSISASNTTTTASDSKNTDGKKNTIVAAIGGILGYLTHQNGLTEISIYLLDIYISNNFIWVDKFEHKPTPSNTILPKPTMPPAFPKFNFVIGALSGIVGTAILMMIGILGYKWYQKKETK